MNLLSFEWGDGSFYGSGPMDGCIIPYVRGLSERMLLDASEPWPAVRVVSAWEQVAQAIRDEIAVRDWSGNTQLPPETVLAAALAVSRGTLRLAMRHLAVHGVIETRRGAHAGTFVARVDLPTARTANHTLTNVIRLRRLIEVPAAGIAARQSDHIRLAAIEDIRRAAKTGRARFEAHRSFHEELLRGGEPIWSVVSEPLFSWLGDNIRRDHCDLTRFDADHAHAQIVDAVRRRDQEAAMTAMSDHLNHLSTCYPQMTRQASTITLTDDSSESVGRTSNFGLRGISPKP